MSSAMMPTTTKSSTMVNARRVGVRSARVKFGEVVGVVIGVSMDP
jgi:LytS/YehU family sensor histidine kinase